MKRKREEEERQEREREELGVERDKSARGDRDENVKGKWGGGMGEKENWRGGAQRK